MAFPIDLLLEATELKDEDRAGWVRRGIENPESVAAHSWGVSLLCLLFSGRAGVDRGRALELAVVHDLPEVRVGDIPRRPDAADRQVTSAEKRAREREAIEAIDAAPGIDLAARWEAFETGGTPEAAFVRDMDVIEGCLQALAYETGGRHGGEEGHLDEFFETADGRLETEIGRELFEAIRTRYARARG